MKILYDKKFLKDATKLPKREQQKLVDRLALLEQNPFDSRLHTKQLGPPLAGILSFRITREYRVLFRFIDADTLFLLNAKHRKDIYR